MSSFEKADKIPRQLAADGVCPPKEGCVSNEVSYYIETLAEKGFIRDSLDVIRSLPPSYERANSFCYITFCKSEHFDCSPEEVVEAALVIAEEGFGMLDDPLPPDKCDRYFAHYVDSICVLIDVFTERRGLKEVECFLDRLAGLVERLTDPMDRILCLRSLSYGYFRNKNFGYAEKNIDEAAKLVQEADKSLWSGREFYHDNELTCENVFSWVDGVKNTIIAAQSNVITIEKIVKGSNEAELRELVLHNNCLTVKAHLPYYGQSNYGNKYDCEQDEITVTITIKANVFDVQMPDTLPLTAYFRLDRLEGVKANSWGYYIPSENKDEFFWSVKNGFALAFGRPFQLYHYLFRIVFGEGHVNVLLADPNDIKFVLEEPN